MNLSLTLRNTLVSRHGIPKETLIRQKIWVCDYSIHHEDNEHDLQPSEVYSGLLFKRVNLMRRAAGRLAKSPTW